MFQPRTRDAQKKHCSKSDRTYFSRTFKTCLNLLDHGPLSSVDHSGGIGTKWGLGEKETRQDLLPFGRYMDDQEHVYAWVLWLKPWQGERVRTSSFPTFPNVGKIPKWVIYIYAPISSHTQTELWTTTQKGSREMEQFTLRGNILWIQS